MSVIDYGNTYHLSKLSFFSSNPEDWNYNRLKIEDIDCFVFHQSNIFMNDTIKKRLKISKKENSDEIFVQMAYPKLAKHYDIEYEEVLSKKLSIVNNPTVISKTNSNDFFHQIQLVNKKYEDDVYINYSSELDASKKRELVNLNSIIQETQISFLDEKDKGINYAILFGI
jgi:hypothetical protein